MFASRAPLLKNKLSCPSRYSVTRQIKSSDLVPHKERPLLHKAVGKLSVMRQILREWSPAMYHQRHTKQGISLSKYKQIWWIGKDNIVVSPDTKDRSKRSCWTGYLTGSSALTSRLPTAEMVQYFKNDALRHNERQYKLEAIPKSLFVSVSKQSRKALFHFQNMARWFKRTEPQTTLYIFIFQDAALLHVFF